MIVILRFFVLGAFFIVSACSEETMKNLESTDSGRTIAEGAAIGAGVCGVLAALGGLDKFEIKNAAAGCAVLGAGVGAAVANTKGSYARQEEVLQTAISTSRRQLRSLQSTNAQIRAKIRSGLVTQGDVRRLVSEKRKAEAERRRLAELRKRPKPRGSAEKFDGLMEDMERKLAEAEKEAERLLTAFA